MYLNPVEMGDGVFGINRIAGMLSAINNLTVLKNEAAVIAASL